jgi:hypothetical protein
MAFVKALRVCALASCDRSFMPSRESHRFCSRKCAAQSSPWRHECGRRGGLSAARGRLERAVRDVRAVWPGMPPEAMRVVLAMARRNWASGWKAGDRSGFRRGFAAANGEAPEITWGHREAAPAPRQERLA